MRVGNNPSDTISIRRASMCYGMTLVIGKN
jgi:hypothetical protein